MSDLEHRLAMHMVAAGLPKPEREYRFDPARKWRFDFAFVEQRLAVECEGGVWTRGRHVQPLGFLNDCEKYNAAALAGWRVLRFSRDAIFSGRALLTIEKALGVTDGH